MKFIRAATLPLAFLALFSFGGANGQPPSKTDEPPRIKSPRFPDNISGAPGQEPKTIEEMLTKLEKLRNQKKEIEKQEKAIIEELKKVYAQLGERLTKLGVLPPPMAIPDIIPLNPGSVPKAK